MATTVTFQPPGGEGYWETPTDWSDGALPDATDDVVISSAYAIVDTAGDVAANVTLEGATQLQVWTGGTLTIGGTIDGSGLTEPTNPYGIFMLGAGTLAVAGGIFDTGILGTSGVIEASVTGGTLISEYAGVTITGGLSGVAVDVNAGSLTLDGSVDAATTIAFEADNNGADLVLAATAPLGQFDGALADWATNSTIDLGGIAWLPGTTIAQLSGDGETLSVSDGGSPLATIHFAAPETGMSFYTELDGGAGTDIVSAIELVDTLGTVADWNDAAIWKPGFVPGPGDNVVVASAGLLQTLTIGAAATFRHPDTRRDLHEPHPGDARDRGDRDAHRRNRSCGEYRNHRPAGRDSRCRNHRSEKRRHHHRLRNDQWVGPQQLGRGLFLSCHHRVGWHAGGERGSEREVHVRPRSGDLHDRRQSDDDREHAPARAAGERIRVRCHFFR